MRNRELGEVSVYGIGINDQDCYVLVKRPNTPCPYVQMQSKGFEFYQVGRDRVQIYGIATLLISLSTGLNRLFDEKSQLGRQFIEERRSHTQPSEILTFWYPDSRRVNDHFVRFVIFLLSDDGKLSQAVAALKDLGLWPEEYADSKLTKDFLGGIRLVLADTKTGNLSDLMIQIATLSRK